jgi:CheY-like chemotaxis protein
MHACDSAVGMGRGVAVPECGQRILLVDDDPDVRAVLGEFLAVRGYAVEACANGAEALAYLRSAPLPQIILLDLQMPIMDGYEFRAAQTQDAALAGIPVVVISDQTTLDRARIDGVAVLPKPFKVDRLVDVIEKHR